MINQLILYYRGQYNQLRKELVNYIEDYNTKSTNIFKKSEIDFFNPKVKYKYSHYLNTFTFINKCYDENRRIDDNILINISIIKEIIKNNPEVNFSNYVEIISDRNKWITSTKPKPNSTVLLSDAIEYYYCVLDKKPNLETIGLLGSRIEHNDYYKPIETKKLDNKKDVILFDLALHYTFDIIEYENMFNRWLNYFFKFINNNLNKKGIILIQIFPLYSSTLKYIKYLIDNKYFKLDNVYTLNSNNPTVSLISYSYPHYLVLTNYNGKKIPDISNINLETENINAENIENKYIELYKLYTEILEVFKKDIFSLNTMTKIKEYFIANNILFSTNLGFKMKIEYKIRYQFNTWKKFLNDYIITEDIVNVLEIGSYEGVSTVWFLSNVLNNDKSTIACVDTWEGSPEYIESKTDFNRVENTFNINVKTHKFKNKVNKYKMRSDTFLLNEKYHNNSLFDIILIDASHDSRDVIIDALFSWKLLKTNGILIFDDYIWNKMPNAWECPKLAIDKFINLFKDNLKILNTSTQIIIQKLK
jgi:predicted O-methyltransferase YrrM